MCIRFNGAAPMKERKRAAGRTFIGKARFNGAAPMKERKPAARAVERAESIVLQRGRSHEGAERRIVPFHYCCFNGAAPMKERKRPGGARAVQDGAGLQWGRSDEGAETTRSMNPVTHRLLQWGRSDEGAET